MVGPTGPVMGTGQGFLSYEETYWFPYDTEHFDQPEVLASSPVAHSDLICTNLVFWAGAVPSFAHNSLRMALFLTAATPGKSWTVTWACVQAREVPNRAVEGLFAVWVQMFLAPNWVELEMNTCIRIYTGQEMDICQVLMGEAWFCSWLMVSMQEWMSQNSTKVFSN